MLALDERAARRHLRVLDDVIDPVDGAHRDAGRQQDRLPLLVGSRQKRFLQRRDERQAVGVALRVGRVSRIVGQLREPDERTKRLPQLVAADADRDVPRSRVERLVGQQHAVRGTHRLRDDAVREIRADHSRQNAELSFEHRDVQKLPASRFLPRVQRRHDAEGGVHARGQIGDRHARAHAVAARIAGDADHAAFRLDDESAARSR